MIHNRFGLSHHLLIFLVLSLLLVGCGRKAAPYWPEKQVSDISTQELYAARI